MTDTSRQQRRLVIVEAMIEALRDPDRLVEAVRPAMSKADAVHRVQRALGVDEVVADHLIDMQFSFTAQYHRAALDEEAQALRSLLA